ncbi:hypothetical protein predicted by Glimmer/Critica [Stenotrophomonas maltophilia RA8]|nr:hypothetical protein predicted by Glimmer/Critica [Stenotrophomonas maltophilia RA8]
MQQAHDRSSVDEPTVAPGHARRPLPQGQAKEPQRCVHCLRVRPCSIKLSY